MFAADPLFFDGVDFGIFMIVVVKLVVAFVFLLVATMVMVWFERKVISDMQNRIGPNVAGPYGILQTLADGIKLFFKEAFTPAKSDPFVFKLAPYLSVVPAFLVFAVIPIGGNWADKGDGTVHIFGNDTFLQLADPPVGILFVLAMSSIAVYGVMLAGWASGSKYPLMGSVRATAQMISYEAALGLSVATVVLISGTLNTSGIVFGQDRFFDWNIVAAGFVPFVVFAIAATAELNRPPFDLVEAEQELVGGYHTEYSSIRFALFQLSEFMGTVTMSALIVTLFLGGPQGLVDLPINDVLESILWFFAKLIVILWCQVWVRATLPRLRYDQLMDLGWKRLIPLSFGWFLLIALIRLARDEDWGDGGQFLAGAIGIIVGLGAWALLAAAIRTAHRNRLEQEAGF